MTTALDPQWVASRTAGIPQEPLTAYLSAGPWTANGQGVTSVTAATAAAGDLLVLVAGCGGHGTGGVSSLSAGVSGGGVASWNRATGYLWTGTVPTLTEIWWGVITALSPAPVTIANSSLSVEWNRLWLAEYSAAGSSLQWALAAQSPTAATSGASPLDGSGTTVTFPALTGTGLYAGGAVGLNGTMSGSAAGWTFATINTHLLVATDTSAVNGTVTGSDTSTDSFSPVAALFTVTGSSGPLSAVTGSLPGGYATQMYPATHVSGAAGLAESAATLAATGGVPPYAWTVTSGSLPSGLTLSAAGLISGTPASAGTASFTVQVADAASSTAAQDLSITISAAPSVVFNGAYPAGTSQWNDPGTDSQVALGSITTPLINNLDVWSPAAGETATSTVWSVRNWQLGINVNNPAHNVTCFPGGGLYPVVVPWHSYSYLITGWDVTMPPWASTTIASATYDNFITQADVITGPGGVQVNEIMHHFAHTNRGEGFHAYQAVPFGGYTVNGVPIPVTYWDISIGSTAVFFDLSSPSGVSLNWSMPAGAIDYLAILNWLVAQGYISQTCTLVSMATGFEVCDTAGITQTFQYNNWWCQAG